MKFDEINLNDQYSKNFLKNICDNANISSIDVSAIKNAMQYAKQYHKNQMRHSGEPFYSHTFAVAQKVMKYFFIQTQL